MKKRSKDTTDSIPLSSPTSSSGVQVDHDCQKVAFKLYSGNGHAADSTSHIKPFGPHRDDFSDNPDLRLKGQKEEGFQKNSTWVLETSSQAYSGPEDNSTDPPETMTETSTLTFVDTQILEESHSLQGAGTIYLKEFVLIDDDDDGDMSLREKTVTDLSIMDGRAADLVCGRLMSTTSGSLTESREETAASPEAPPPDQPETLHTKRHCCFCTLL